MKSKIELTSHRILNLTLFVLIIASTYAWMLTNPSTGEIVDYERTLVITSSTVDVEFYVFENGTYVKTNDDPITTGLLGPGMMQKYMFRLTNNNSLESSTNIIFSDITGNIDILKDVVSIGETNPSLFEDVISSKLVYDSVALNYSYIFQKEFNVPANSSLDLYWYISIDKYAANEISNTSFNINKIMFVKP